MSETLTNIIVGLGPMVLLVGIWLFIIYRVRRGGYVTQYQKDCMELTKRQVEALERIAKSLESKG